PTSIETRGISSCFTETPIRQSLGRTPDPCRIAGSYVLVKIGLPKLLLLRGPQRSPPLARLSCCAGFRKSQSGTKLPFPSVHVRVTGGGAVSCEELPTMRAVGFDAG